MEAMNETLHDILKNDYFTRDHLQKLTSLLQRLFETKYRHSDLHVNNIMWSDRLKDFRIVDWECIILIPKIVNTKYKEND